MRLMGQSWNRVERRLRPPTYDLDFQFASLKPTRRMANRFASTEQQACSVLGTYDPAVVHDLLKEAWCRSHLFAAPNPASRHASNASCDTGDLAWPRDVR